MTELGKQHELHDLLVNDLQRNLFGYIGRQLIDAYTIDNYRPSITMYDTPLLDGHRPDLVAIIHSGAGIHLTAIIEVKRTMADLGRCGPQLADYLGSTSCLFLAVPTDLVASCICKIQHPHTCRLYTGVINASNGDVVVLPLLQNHDVYREAHLLCNISAEPIYRADETGLYRPHDIPIRASTPVFTQIDGMTVRNKYADVYRNEMRQGYPYPNKDFLVEH